MRRAFSIWLLFVVLILNGAPAAYSQIYPQYADVYVDDFAELLTPEDEKAIRTELVALYDQTGVEAVVVTLPSLARYHAFGPIEPYATALFNTWGIGAKDKNNGVLMLVVRDDRKMRIEVGSGYGHSLDAEMQYIIDKRMVPQFKNLRYADGIHAGVTELVRVLQVKAGVLAPPNTFQRFMTLLQDASAAVLTALGAAIAGLGFAASWLYQQWSRSRPRYCPADGHRMDLMGEDYDDAKLEHGQTVEEQLGSVDYDVWSCPTCQHVTIETYRRWFSRYGACRSCNFRTLEGTTTVLRAATTSEAGLKKIDYHCHNCNAEHSETKSIPRLSSSSGSSRSSFGGGRSGGGGASGSW